MSPAEKLLAGVIAVIVLGGLLAGALLLAQHQGSVPPGGGPGPSAAPSTASGGTPAPPPEGASAAAAPPAGPSSPAPLSALEGGEAHDAVPSGPPSPAGPGVVTGRVVDRNLEPIEGASVFARPEGILFGPRSPARPDVAPGRTDADGTYRIRLAGTEPYTLRFEHPDFAPALRKGVRARESEEVLLEDIGLGPGGTVSGRVADPAGRPLAGVAIRVHPLKTGPIRFSARPGGEGDPDAWSEEDGTFRVEHVPAGEVSLEADEPSHPTAATGRLEVKEGEEVAGVEIVLEEGRELGGHVFGPDGKPIEGASVRARAAREGERSSIIAALDLSLPGSGSGRSTARTDVGGVFRLRGLAPGSYALDVKKKGFARAAAGPFDAGTSDAVIRLERNGSVRGRVVDARTGEPLRRFRATLAHPPNEGVLFLGRGAATPAAASGDFESDDGTFELEDVEEGTYRLTIRARGFAEGTADDVAVSRGLPTEAPEIALAPGASVEGIVLTAAEGAPVKGARVRAIRRREGRKAQSMTGIILNGLGGGMIDLDANRGETVTTGEEGRFRFEDLKAGTYDLTVLHPRYIRQKVEDLALDPEAPLDPLEIRLRLGGGVEGTVFGTDGYPSPGAKVQVTGSRGFFERITSDGLGNYHLGGLAPGRYRLKLLRKERPGMAITALITSSLGDDGEDETSGGLLQAEGAPVEVREGEVARLDLYEEPGGSIAGTVREGGSPVPDIRVGLERKGGLLPLPASATTDRDGRFEFPDLEPGSFAVVIHAPEDDREIARRDVEVRAGLREDLDLDLPTSFVDGLVLARRGRRPVEGARVTLTPQREGVEERRMVLTTGDTRTIVTSADGRFHIPRVAPGRYSLEVVREGFARERLPEVTVESEGTSQLEVLLSEGASVRGEVRNPRADVPIAFASVMILDPAGSPLPGAPPYAVTDQNGKFRIDGLWPGEYVLRCTHFGFGQVDTPFHLRGGETADLTIRMNPDG